MDSNEVTSDNFWHTAAPEYNYGVPMAMGLEAISGAMIVTGMDYNQPIKFVLGGIVDL